MGGTKKSKRGSQAMRPLARAREITPRIRSWRSVAKPGLLGFPAYKVGMKRIGMIDDSTSPSKGMEIAVPVTVLEAPVISVFGIRAYRDTPTGTICLGDVVSAQPKVAGKLGMKKETKHKEAAWLDSLSDVSRVSVLALTNPDVAGTPAKVGEVVEIAIGGKDAKEQIEFAKSILGKDVAVKDVFEEGEWLDTIAVTRSKGWAGPIKRFGVAKQRRKATGRIRHVGTLGPWHPAYVMYTAPQAGQKGFHRRTQYNVRLLAISEPAKINIPGGFPHYGEVKTNSLLVQGSVQGTQKRFVFLRKGLRAEGTPKKPQITWM